MHRDTLYQKQSATASFEFNEQVADVFADMISRSLPGYPLTLSMLGVIAHYYIKPHGCIYDLGTALGAVVFEIARQVTEPNCRIIGVDNSLPMISRCQQHAEQLNDQRIEFSHQDICDITLSNATMVVMNFTLQFVPIEQRTMLLANIYQNLLSGGVLVLSEKIHYHDEQQNQQLQLLHEHSKRMNDYNELEIAQKRTALEHVLKTETIDQHTQRLHEAGFDQVNIWFQCLNFISLIAVKSAS